MKNIYLALLFISTSLFAQQYEKDWDKVIKNENVGKIKTANEIVDKIYKKAVAKKNEVQIIKCFFYSSKYLQVVDENAQTKILNHLKTQIGKVSIPSQAILNLVYAKCLSDYLYYGTAVNVDAVIAVDENLAEATSETKINAVLNKTLENENILKNIPLSNYEPIFDFFEQEKFKKESLFDYVLSENISIYTTKISPWAFQPRNFKEYKKSLLGDSNEFIGLKLDFVKDTILKKVLFLCQKRETNNPSAENQLDRITFCNDYLLKFDEDFLQTLNVFQKSIKEEMLLQKIQLAKANIYSRLASKETHPDYNIKAISILDSILAFPNKSNAYQLAQQKKQGINTKSLAIQLQKYSYNNENTRAFVRYKNVDNFRISFFKINYSKIAEFHNTPNKIDSLATQIVTNRKALITKKYDLIDKKNYFEYTTEVLLPQLEKGNYLVYFESDTNSTNKKGFGYETITVSNISVLANSKGVTEYYTVLDRKTGKPMENVSLKSSYFDIKTNANGLATYNPKGSTNSYSYNFPTLLTTANDTILINKSYVTRSIDYSENGQNEKAKGKVEFYLDRAIYRPGQTVYYKGVAVHKKQNTTTVVPKTTFKITLKDANYKEIKTIDVTTNDFGSFSGEFVLPKNGLTGNFSIEATKPENYLIINKAKDENPFWDNVDFENSRIGFNVEEYKRPKFEVVFDPTKESYQVNQKITANGNAKAFAGSNITDAKVSYTVTRYIQNNFRYYHREEPEVITTGETKTDATGKFSIAFIAKPSDNSTKEQLPVFDYQISATITDNNGESHDAKTSIKVGYHALELKTIIPPKIETKSKNEILLNSTNLNDQFVATKGDIKLYFINEFGTKFKSRVWEIPEIESIADEDFNRLFPYEINQKPITDKDKGVLIYTKSVDTDKDKNLPLDFIANYKSGNYKVVFTAKDKFGNPIENSNSFEIIQSKDTLNPSQLITLKQLNNDPKKDGFVLVQLKSVIPELFINTTGNYENKVFFEENTILKNNQATVKIPLNASFKKAVNIGFESVFENQTYAQNLTVVLKTEDPKLLFEIESFRNKIQPGSPENWSFKLNASNTAKESEILASMYDSSLDQFAKQNWDGLNFYEYNRNYVAFKSGLGFEKTYSNINNLNPDLKPINLTPEDTKLNWFGFDFNGSVYNIKDKKIGAEPVGSGKLMEVITGYGTQKKSSLTGAVSTVLEDNSVYALAGIEMELEDKASGITTKKALEELAQVKARTNLSETAFFYPNLKTDSKGKVSFDFTSPEALTAWKLRLLAHNKNAIFGYLEKNIITQKDLMITPNFPRFFREKDSITITTKIANITNKAKTGIAALQLFDATTMQPIDARMGNANTIKNFNILAYGNTTVSWKIYIPEGLQGVQYKVLAKAGNFSDGEENILPVLTNNMLVTESIPIWVRGNSKKEYTFENLKNNNSTTLKNHQFTLEYTSNPSWTAIQSLPYLMEYEHECTEQTFARFYANALASEIISSNPKIASLFETWRKNGKLNSKLEENEELKSMILAETPWLNDAQSEDEKKKNLALLFDLEKMKNSQEATFNKLKLKQKSSGGFAWFDGSQENEYITRHILAGLGHLRKLDKGVNVARNTVEIANQGITYIDNKFLETYKRQTVNQKKKSKIIWPNSNSDLHYLYTRSFYLEDYLLSDTLKVATKKYVENIKENWLSYSLYEKGMATLVLNRFGEKDTAKKIIESLKETASNNEDWGMYWIANKSGWYWYQAPIETQALLIEAFAEVTNDTKSVDAMKVWLLKNKQTKNWPTTKSTTEAIYALLMQGTDWLSVRDNTVIKIGDEKILSKKLSESDKEAETGYIKLNWKANEINKNMATISVENKSKVPGFGGIYWQYFEDLDKIKNNSGAVLSVSKEFYLKKNTVKGDELQKITTKNSLKTGDLVTVRLIITTKEDMEFVHLKDMRAACFEPIDVLSGYEYKDGLGFYRSTKDTATHFFFDQINKGTYVLEYDIRVNNQGDFSNGITTIESMYAPEFTSHTKGTRVNVKE